MFTHAAPINAAVVICLAGGCGKIEPTDQSTFPLLIVQPDQVLNGQAVFTNGGELIDIQALAPTGAQLAVAVQGGQFVVAGQTPASSQCLPVPAAGQGLLQILVAITDPTATATLFVTLVYPVTDASINTDDASSDASSDAGPSLGSPGVLANPPVCSGYYPVIERALRISDGTPVAADASAEAAAPPVQDAEPEASDALPALDTIPGSDAAGEQ